MLNFGGLYKLFICAWVGTERRLMSLLMGFTTSSLYVVLSTCTGSFRV